MPNGVMNQKISYILKNKDKLRPVELEAFLMQKQAWDSATKSINALYEKMRYKEQCNAKRSNDDYLL